MAVQVVGVTFWDPFIRVTHWLLAAAVLFDWVTDEPLRLYNWVG